jgi:hypothetical protein
MDWHSQFEVELQNARRARDRGNEGQARVCARRAAGIVAGEFLLRLGRGRHSRSALVMLSQLQGEGSLPEGSKPLIDHLLQPVNLDFKLPPGVDLIRDAQRLRELLVPD